MNWTATLYVLTPEELKGRLAADTPDEFAAIIGSSNGKGYPTFTDTVTGKPLAAGDVWARLLREAWDGYGPTGTGCVGQVRDMLYAMATFAEGGGFRLEVPEDTRRKAAEEAAADAAALPEGAVH